MPTERLPLTPKIENRNASNTKDAIGYNCLYETVDGKKRVIKRPGLYQLPVTPALPTGKAQGLFQWNNYFIVGQSGGLYGINGSTSNQFGSIAGTQTPWSFCQTKDDQYLVVHNGANLYTLNKTGNVFGTAIVNSVVASVKIDNGGAGYLVAPSVTFSAPPSGTTALGSAQMQNGAVTGVTIINPGTGYTAAPTVTFGDPTDTPIAATLTYNMTQVGTYPDQFSNMNASFGLTSITVVSPGHGYVQGCTFTVTANFQRPAWDANTAPVVNDVVASGYCNVTNGGISSLVVTSYAVTDGHKISSPIVFTTSPAAAVYNTRALGTAVMSSGSPTILGPYAFGIAYLNSRVFLLTTSGIIYQSALDNPTSWSASEWIYANSDPDDGIALARHLNYLVAFGSWSTQFFYDAGNPSNSTLADYPAAKLEIGCASGPTVSSAEHTVLWVGQGLTEGRGVYMLEGTSPVKISTTYVDRILNASILKNTRGFCFKVSGHTLYMLTLSDDKKTLVYDLEEKEWYEWTSQVGGVEDYFAFTYFCGNVEYAPGIYLQHETNGQVYKMDPDYYTDAGNSIYFRVRTSILDAGNNKRKFFRRTEVIGDRGPATLSIKHSDDDYSTWSNDRTVSMSTGRPVLYQCGSSRRRAWEVFSSDNQPIRIEALEIDLDSGE